MRRLLIPYLRFHLIFLREINRVVKFPKWIFCALPGLFFAVQVFAQDESGSAEAKLTLDVTEVSLLKVSSDVISLQLKSREAGLPLEFSASDSTARLLISSVVSAHPRTLSACISEGKVPPGTVLKIVAQQPNVAFVGSAGIFASPVILDETDKPFVTEIMTCYSGTELSDGYPIKFIYELDGNTSNYGLIRASTNASVTIKFTLTEAQ